jgi:Lon protease-like protein
MTLKDLPKLLPLYAAQGTVLLPRTQLPLLIEKEEDKATIDYALQEGRRFLGILQENPLGGHFQKGCLGRITNFQEGTRFFIMLEGVCRFSVERIMEDVLFKAQVNYLGYEQDLESSASDPLVNRPRLLRLLKDYLLDQDITANWEEIDHASDDIILNSLIMACPFGPPEKQALLETLSLSERCDIMIALMEMGHFPFQGPRPMLH